MKIALLGWGSLLWETHQEFDRLRGNWQSDGPDLKLEFCRVSSSRKGALTLVIHQSQKIACQVSYAISKRIRPEDAVSDLKRREGTVLKNIGVLYADGSDSHGNDKATQATIAAWATAMEIDVVVWTALESNFKEKTGKDFNKKNALDYVASLAPEAKAKAAEYIWRAPEFVNTPIRRALQVRPWFAPRRVAKRVKC